MNALVMTVKLSEKYAAKRMRNKHGLVELTTVLYLSVM